MFNSKSVAMVGLTLAAGAAANAGMIMNGSGGSIPDNNASGYVSTITSPAIDTPITGIEVAINGLSHAWIGQLAVSLIHVATGTEVFLFNRIGAPNGVGSGKNVTASGNYTFNDGAATTFHSAVNILGSGSTVASGTYRTTTLNGIATSLATFVGLSTNSAWNLKVVDRVSGVTGSFESWSVNLSFVPAPGPVALAAMAGVVAARRRR